jgi:hypothetical protein
MKLDNSFFLGKNKIGTSNESIKDAVDRLSKTVPIDGGSLKGVF